MWYRSERSRPALRSNSIANRARIHANQVARQTNLRLEQLEERRLLAITDMVAGGVLTITADAADNIAVTSVGGNVQINGADPQTGPAASNTITSISITASGTFSNTIDLSGIDSDFTALTLVTADGGDGADAYDINTATFPAAATMNIADSGATGGDALNINAGGQAFTWTVLGENNYNFQGAGAGEINFTSASGVIGGGTLANAVNSGINMVLDGGGTPTTGTLHTTTFSSPSAGNTQIQIDSFFLVTAPTAQFNNLTVNGTTDPDNVVVDLTNGDPLPHGLTYTGGGTPGANSLTVQGGSVTNLTYNATGVGAGNLSLDGTPINFTQLSPITVTSTVANVAINVSDTVPHQIALGAAGAGTSEVIIDGGYEEMTFANPTASLSLTGTGHADTITLNALGSGFAAPAINITDGSGAEVDILATPASSTTTVATNVATLATTFFVNVGSTASTFNMGAGSLANILGNVQFNDLATAGNGALFVDDSADTTAKTVGVTSSQIAFSGGIGTIGYTGNQTNAVNVAAGTGGNTFNVTSTSSHAFTSLYGGFGTGTNTNAFNVSVPGLANETQLFGEGIASTYNANFTGGSSLAAGAQLIVNGHSGGNSNNRDTVNLNAQSGAGGRTVGFDYQSGSTGSNIYVTGLGGAAPIQVGSVEQVNYNGAAAGDNLSVTGPTTPSDITVAPQTSTSALVFLGAINNGPGSGWNGPPAGYTTTLPGVAGGSLAPDLFLSGSKTTGVSIHGGATNNDQLTVYAPSETQVNDPTGTSNPFGFGVGVIVPGHPVGSVYNTIAVSDAKVTIADSSLGALLPVNIASPAPFVQTVTPLQTPGLIVDSGDQASSQGSGIADNITATLSANFKIQVNGGNPTAIPNSTNGDKLTIATPPGQDINVWNDNSNPTNVTINSAGTIGIGYSSIENLALTPGSGVVNVYGNNNNPAGPAQSDYDKVVGTGANAFQLQVGISTGALPAPPANQVLSAPINFSGVTTLNVFGGPDTPPTFADSVVNTLNITPWANNTPQAWGVQTFYNQGGTTTGDLLIWNGLAGVSEAITVQPSGPLEGQVYAINSATSTPVAVVNYTGNLGIAVQGTHSGTGEIDTLTLDGTSPANGVTSGTDDFLANFANAGTAAAPLVAVTDAVSLAQLYNVLYFSNISTINFNTLGGADTVDIASLPTGVVLPDGTTLPTNGSFKINIDGGQPGSSAATLVFNGSSSGGDTFTVTPGATADAGSVDELLNGAVSPTTITFRRAKAINIVGTSSGTESLTMNGSGNGDSFVVSPGAGVSAGTVQVDGNVPVNFSAFGAGTSTLLLNGGNGNAKFNITPIAGVAITAEGGGQATSNQAVVNGTSGADTIGINPGTANSATVQVNAAGLVSVLNTASLAINGQGGTDDLTYTGPASLVGINHLTFVPGATPDAGTIIGREDGGTALTPVTFSNVGAFGTLTLADANPGRPDTLDFDGTAASDVFDVSAGAVQVFSQTGFFTTLTVFTPPINLLTLHGMGGNDTFNVSGSLPFNTTIDADATVNLTGAVGPVAIGVADSALSTNTTVTGYGGTVTLIGVATANLDLTGGSSLTANGYSEANSFTYTPTGTSAGSFTDAGVDTTFNFANASSTFAIDGGTSGANQVTVQGTSGNDTITATSGVAVAGDTQVAVNSLMPVQIVTADTASLAVNGNAGNDNLTVNSTSAPVTIPIAYNGGTGTNALTLTGGTATADVYTPGSQLGAGTDTLTFAGGTELVNFQNLAPVFDLVVGPLTVNGNKAANAINYSVGFNNLANYLAGTSSATWGQVSVDSQEPIEFINKVTLTLNGLAGSDQFNLNNANTPTGLTSIAVDGGDPTTSNTLVVNGIAATPINVSPTAPAAATITGAGLVPIAATNVQQLVVNGQGQGDTLTVTTPAGANTDTYTPGAAIDAGSIQVGSLLPISYTNLGAAGAVTLANTGGTRVDTLNVNGTAGNDTFGVASSGDVTLNGQLVLHTPGVAALVLNGLLGNDVFNVAGGSPFTSILLNGDAIANFTGATGAVGVALADSALNTNTVVSGYGPNVTLVGVATANLDLTGGFAATANGYSEPNAFNYQPTSASAGTFTDAGVNTTFNLTNSTGTFTIDGGASGGTNKVVVQGTSGDDTITAAVGANPANTQVAVNSLLPVQIVTAHTASLVINGNTGNDGLTVNSSTAPVTIPITYNGGTGTNALTLTGGTATADIYTPGSQLGAGTDTLTFAGGTESVNFQNLAPVFDLVNGPLTVNGTNAANAINYSVGFNNLANFLSVTPSATWGQVSVDSYEPIEFIHKTTLTLNGLAGSDQFNLNNPNTPTGLTAITVDGGDPTTSNTLVVNGTAAADIINVSPTAPAAANITGAGPVGISATNVQQLVVNGQGGGDGLTVTTPAGANTDTVTPGAAIDSGSIQVGSLLPISYSNLGAAGALTFANAGAADTLNVQGTAGNDTFTVAATNGAITLNGQLPIRAPGIAALILNGLGGVDTFNITGALPANYKQVLVNAAGASGDDPLNVNGTAGVNNAIAVNLQPAPLGALGNVQQITGLGAPIGIQGVGTVNINGGSAGNTNTLSVSSATPTSALTVTPTGANSGTFQNSDGSGPTFNFATVTGAFTVNGAGTSNQLTVIGTANADTININSTQIAVVGLIPVNYTGMAAVTANGLQGADTFNVTPSATTAIKVNGNDPIGVLPGDTLNIIPGGNPVTFFPGPLSDQGGFQVGADQAVSYTGIETIGPINMGGGPGPVLILGTNGNDTFTVIARDSSYNPLADGIQDYTVSVDAGPNILFLNAPTLYLDGLNGSDTFNVRMPAPNNADWNTNVFIAGGPSSSDQLLVQTVGTQTVNYSPTGAETGTFTLLQPAPSTITTGPFTIPAIPYTSSTGGVEQFIYDGQTGNSNLTVTTPAGANLDSYTSGAAPDAGTIAVGSLLPINFQNLGATGSVTLANTGGTRTDTLTVNGTVGNDIFGVAATDGTVTLNNQLPLATPGVKSLILNGQVGIDTFNVAATIPYANILVNSGTASTADPLNVIGTAGNDAIAVNLQPTLVLGDLVPTITGLGGTIGILGVDAVNIDGGGGTDTLTVNGTTNDETLTYTPTGAAAGNFFNNGAGPLYSFTNITGTITANGGTGGIGNQVVVNATNNNDTTIVDSPNRTVTVFSAANFVTPLKPVILSATTEEVTAQGGLGNDSFLVIPAARVPGPDVVVGAVGFSVPTKLLVNINGGTTGGTTASLVVANYTPGAGGSLNPAGATQIQSGPGLADEFAVVNRNSTISGVVRIFQNSGGNEPFQFPDISYNNVGIVDPLASTNAAGQLNELVLGPDPNQPNGSLSTATFLGSGSTINANNLALFPNAFEHTFVPSDQSYYQVVAQQTGTLDFQVYFQLNPGMLPDSGQLNIQVLNAAGQVLGQSFGPTKFGAASTTPAASGTGDRVRIPVVAGQSYYLRVFGADNTVINGYKATIINTPPPVPYDVELSRSVAAGIAGSPDTGDLPTNAPADDTGRSQFDNVTKDNTPTIYLRLADGIFQNDLPGNGTPGNPPVGVVPIPFSNTSQTTAGFNVAIFDGNNTQTPVGFATQVAGFPGLYTYTFTTPLADGIHNIVAAVQMVDPQNPNDTGFGLESTSLAITIDTVVPPVQFGITSASGTTTGLDAASDSGALGTTDAGTLADRITNVKEPTFYGTAEANSIVKLYAIDNNGNPLLLGQTTATPIDGTNADPNGQWTITSTVDLDDPSFFAYDGVRHLFVTAEDLAGNINTAGSGVGPNAQQITIFLDTTGPQIANVGITGDPTFNLFGLKSGNNAQGPTPLVNSLTITVTDNPNRDPADFPIDPAILADIASTPGQYELVGDASGVIAISQIIVTNNPIVAGQPATATVKLVFAQPLPDDRFTLTIKSTGLVDPAGNDLDGESNAVEPNGAPTFPSGDGQPGGDFAARFTVDTRPEIGTYAAGSVYVDINGNMTWDPTNTDATNRDLIFTLGLAPSLQGAVSPMGIHDALIAGDFLSQSQITRNAGPPAAVPLAGQQKIGYDKLAAYGYDSLTGTFRWLVDTNSDEVIDPAAGDYEFSMAAGSQINGVPLAGDFALNPAAGDQIGLFDGTTWFLDTSTNIASFANAAAPGGSLQFSTPFLTGAPVVGDFNGAVAPNGAQIPDLATYLNGTFHIVFGQYNAVTKSVFYVADAAHEDTVNMGFAGVGGIPLAADMNADGITDLGVFEPRTTGVTPQTAEWYWLVSNAAANPTHAPNASALNHPFSPTPLGSDIFADFGAQSALPIVGNFDPPVSNQVSGAATAVGNVLGSANVSGQSIAGQALYSFSPLRSGTLTVSATGASAVTGVTLYDSNMNVLASGSTQATNAVTAGTQYFAKVTANSTAVDVNFADSISQQALLDANQDGMLSPLDALAIINELNSQGSHAVALTPGNSDIYHDTNLDGVISPLDALAVINALNAASAAAKAAVAKPAIASPAVASPAVASAAVATASGSSTSTGGLTAVAAGVAAGSAPPVDGSASANILATDAVFAGLASSSETSTATNLQSKGSVSTLGSTSTVVRRTSNTAGSSGTDNN